MTQTPAGWYPDGQGQERYWDGSAWTEQTRAPEAPAPEAPAPDPDRTVVRGSSDAQRAAQGYGPGGQPPAGPPPGQQPAYGQQPGQPAYGPPAGSQWGAPTGQPAGAPGQPGQPAWGTPGPTKKPLNKGLIAAIGGGAVVVIAVIVVLVLTLGGGGGGSSDDPKSVAQGYVDAVSDFDFDKACDYLSADAKKSMLSAADADDCSGVKDGLAKSFDDQADGVMTFDEFIKDIDISVSLGEVKKSGDTATVDYKATMKYTGDNSALKSAFDSEDSSTSDEIDLVKEDGDWKVDQAGDIDFSDLG
ncbi:DUF2510 domain-containing protein [Nocardioides cheoyonin]|uniref:Rv0361 family membrane protein n=1 Tax=Nocardioides cheoyonin TaxID=3156615 RepID=UPI0032B3BD1C